MLAHLHIEHYALISSLEIDFGGGFSVLTGETGAGKSIILGALGLLMGERADSRYISEGASKCVIEAEFTDVQEELADVLRGLDVDVEEPCLLRREISSNGKSRAFINDTPVTAAALREVSGYLIDIHSQHENLLLADDRFCLSLVDSIAQNEDVLAAYQQTYRAYRATERQLQALEAEAMRSQKDADYLRFQWNQLVEAQLQVGEEAALEQEVAMLAHAEEIKTQLQQATLCLTGETAATDALKEALAALRKIERYLPQEASLPDRLQSVYIELKDIAETLEAQQERTDFDPARLAQAEERLDLINTLLRKHQVQTTEALLALQEQLGAQLQHIDNYDDEVEHLRKQWQSEREQVKKQAERLRATRAKVLEPIAEHLRSELQQLAMPNARVQVDMQQAEDYGMLGGDSVQLLFSANKNQVLRRASEVASGGEIARLMLCIKAMLAQRKGLPTIIFDEIDTGVSGEIASRMGRIMQQLGVHRQVISITHLPQIAAAGQVHYKVYKSDNEHHTESHIVRLTEGERVQEIAQMLSGSMVTVAAMENARQLLADRQC